MFVILFFTEKKKKKANKEFPDFLGWCEDPVGGLKPEGFLRRWVKPPPCREAHQLPFNAGWKGNQLLHKINKKNLKKEKYVISVQNSMKARGRIELYDVWKRAVPGGEDSEGL